MNHRDVRRAAPALPGSAKNNYIFYFMTGSTISNRLVALNIYFDSPESAEYLTFRYFESQQLREPCVIDLSSV